MFVQQSGSRHKSINTIWEVESILGEKFTCLGEIHKEATSYFEGLFQERVDAEIDNQLEYIHLYPLTFSKAYLMEMDKLILMEEVISFLISFTRDKFHAPNGWTIHIFTHFMDIMGGYLL